MASPSVYEAAVLAKERDYFAASRTRRVVESFNITAREWTKPFPRAAESLAATLDDFFNIRLASKNRSGQSTH